MGVGVCVSVCQYKATSNNHEQRRKANIREGQGLTVEAHTDGQEQPNRRQDEKAVYICV